MNQKRRRPIGLIYIYPEEKKRRSACLVSCSNMTTSLKSVISGIPKEQKFFFPEREHMEEEMNGNFGIVRGEKGAEEEEE
ncbi:unnamed protein product [Allacma fusca]|uniref:Uncharacterized protein n=1 Tax=Allacma fusca TaxID=39272 RepID=A0A8J2PD85_9HEXA|nr:unnamed protein product [Allacma fusca]